MKGIYIDERYWAMCDNNVYAVIVYSVIAFATKKGGWSNGQKELANTCHLPLMTTRRALAKLVALQLIDDTKFIDGRKVYRSVPKEQTRMFGENNDNVPKEQTRMFGENNDTLYKNINKMGKKEESPKDGGDFISFAAVVMEDFKKWFEYVKGVPFSNNSDTLTECREIAGQIAQLMRAQNLNADNVEEFRAFFRKWIKAAYEVCDRWQKDNFSLTTLKRQFNQLTAKINGNTLNNDELAAALADIKQAQRIIAQNRQAGNA